jgi:hypothetical protein
MHFANKKLVAGLALTSFLIMGVSNLEAVEGFDDPQPKKASEILPADLITGDHFKVLDGVTWNDGLHEFTVETEFGSFDVWGEPMLRVRLAEVDAWTKLEKASSVGAGVKALGGGVMDSIGALASAFAHPLKTVKGVPTGIGRMFHKAEHSVDKAGDFVSGDNDGKSGEVAGDDNAIAKLSNKMIGVNKSYRRLAQEYGVNPYTTNEALQEELLRLAKVDAVARKGSNILLPGVGLGLSVVVKVTKAVYEHSWLEIVARNEDTLEEMGASPDQIKALFSNDSINLTLMTMMLETLKSMEGVEGRLNVIDQMILLETDAEAVFFGECLLMADWYNENESPLVKMLPGTLVPVALTADKKVIAFSAVDFAYWTPDQAAIVVQFTDLYRDYSPQREAWIADQVSPRFVGAVGELGWTVRSGMRSSVMPEIPWGLSDD